MTDPYFSKLNYKDHLLKFPFNEDLNEDVDLNQIDKKLIRPIFNQ